MHMARSLRLSLLVLAVFAAPMLKPLAVHAFSNATLRGSYGCLGSLFFVTTDSSGAPTSEEISAVEQLSFKAGAVGGSLRLQLSGEDCSGTVASGSSYSVGPNGIGSMSLILTFTTDPVDRDARCAGLNPLFNPHKLDLVVQENGKQFSFAGQDDLLSAPKDGGDFPPASFKGTCVSQTSP